LGLLTVMGLGTMALVLPLSWLADHVDRMGMLAACVLLTMAGAADAAGGARKYSGRGMPSCSAAWRMIYTLGVILVGER
jgi:hypothetical protein